MRPLRTLGLCVALATCTIGTASVAAAQAAGPSAADRDTARNLMDIGDEHFDAGRYEEALESYEAADEIMNVPTTRFAVGKTQEKLGKLVEARDTLLSVRQLPVMEDETGPLEEARTKAAELAFAIGKRIPTLEIMVRGVPEVDVQVDGTPIERAATSVPRRMNPGTHQVVVTAPGYQQQTRSVTLTEGDTQKLEIQLEPLPQTPAPPPLTKPTPTVRPLPDDGSRTSSLVYIGFSVGAAGLLVGAITGGIALATASSLEDACDGDRCPRSTTEEDFDTTLALSHASTAGFVVAGVGGALGLIGLLVMGSDDEDTTVSIAPGGLVIRGVF